MKLVDIFKQPTAAERAVHELEIARCELQEAESLSEYYTALVAYNIKRIQRLTNRVLET